MTNPLYSDDSLKKAISEAVHDKLELWKKTGETGRLMTILEECESHFLKELMPRYRYNQFRLALALNMSRNTLRAKLKKCDWWTAERWGDQV